MKVSLNTNILNSNYNGNRINTNPQFRNNTPSFTGWSMPQDSKLLEPLRKFLSVRFDRFTDKIATYYHGPVYSSKPARWLAKNGDKTGKIVNHMQSLGSIIISGMYMTQTLRNPNMDEDRKKTLAVNQGLTWLASTLGAYWIDSALDEKWDKHINIPYAAKHQGMERKKLFEAFENYNKDLETKHKINLDSKKFKPVLFAKYAQEEIADTVLNNKIKGLNVLKSLIVFNTVYRFLGPVAVTPLANMIGNSLFNKHEKKTDKIAQNQSDTSFGTLISQKPDILKFAKGIK